MNIWWIRRDLRLEDNPALSSALAEGKGVVPVFIMDPQLLGKPAEKRQAFLFSGLRALDADLKKIGSALIVRQGNPVDELKRLAGEVNAEKVFSEGDFTPYAVRRDKAVAQQVELKLVHGLGVHHPAVVTKADGSPYTVFTPYSRAWKALPFNSYTLPAPDHLNPLPTLESVTIPLGDPQPEFPAGEVEARRRLNIFLSGVSHEYADGRNRLDLEGTSTLSPYLRFGMLSARLAVVAAQQVINRSNDPLHKKSLEVWINELIWREFYQSILYYFPHVLDAAFKTDLRNIPWRKSSVDLQAWQEGRTGFPVVDAGMLQLAATGWMHNRARMITASFLVKDLLINWQEGERWFMRTLIDGDPAANNGGWQWTAGTGTDAAPYFRIFNPILQGKKFDPEGEYVRRWVPELKNVPDKHIHTPWEMSAEVQRAAGLVIGKVYPAPIVDHAASRERTLAAYKVR